MKTLKWTVIGLLGLVTVVLVLLYIPPVQDFVTGRVIGMLNSSGDMHLSVKKLRLTFPLKISADSLAMQTSGI